MTSLLVLAVSACGAADTPAAKPSREALEPRPNTFCPRLSPGQLPQGWVALDSELVNLGDRTFGRIDTFGEPQARGADAPQVQIHVGVDGLEALEDLDFEPSVVESHGQRFRLYRTPVEAGLFALKSTRGEGSCAERTLISRAITQEQLIVIALGLEEPDA